MMKKLNILVPVALLAFGTVDTAMAGVINEAFFHVDFGGDNVNDTSTVGAGGISTGTGNSISFTDVAAMPRSNGRGAVFNGVAGSTASYIDYGTGESSELQHRQSLTYHIRVKFDVLSGDQFLMGRWGDNTDRISTMFAGGTVVNCDASNTGAYISGYRVSTPSGILQTNTWYDIFYRFNGTGNAASGYMQVNVFEVSSANDVASDPTPVATSLTHLANLPAVLFRVGASRYNGAGWNPTTNPHATFDGTVDQINVWNRALEYGEMQSIMIPPDFKGKSLNLAPEAALWGETCTVDTTLSDSGSDFLVNYYLSTDETIDTNDHLIASWNTGGLGNERRAITLPSAPPSGFGREFYLGIVVDVNGDIDETDETNNSGQGFGIDYRKITIGAPDAWADGSVYKYYTMLSPETNDCAEHVGHQFVDPAGTSGNTWSITAGSLPPGIAMTTGGYVSGTPADDGVYDFSLRASGSGGDLDFDCQMTVHPPRSEWFEDAKLGYRLFFYSSDDADVATIEAENAGYNASNQVAAAVAAGAEYVVFPAQTLSEVRYWPSEVPAFSSPKTNRDFVQEVVDACHYAGIKVLLSYSIDPHGGGEFNAGGDSVEGFQLWQRKLFQELMLKGADGFWFDGTYFTREWYGNGYFYWMWTELEAVIRRCNPEALLITNPGAVKDWWNSDDDGWSDWKAVDEGPADIDIRTLEQFAQRTTADHQTYSTAPPAGYNFSPTNDYNYFVVPFGQDASHELWPKRIPGESAAMLGKTWAWTGTASDYEPVKAWDDLVRYSIKCWNQGVTVGFATGCLTNGIYNTGDAAAMSGIGAWMTTNGTAVYGTRQGYGFSANCTTYSTRLLDEESKVDEHFLFVIDYHQPGGSTIEISNFPADQVVKRCYHVDNPGVDLPFTQAGGSMTISNVVWSNPATVVGVDIMASPASILEFSAVPGGTVMKMVVDTPDADSRYSILATTNLVGGSWASVGHSTNGLPGTFSGTNLGYSISDPSGTNAVIYVEADTEQKFFGLDGK